MNDPLQPGTPEYDQQLANIRNGLPALWWALYVGCMEAGFSEVQAMRCVIAFISKPEDA